MSSATPASTNTSASPSFWQVMPIAPAAICIFAIAGILCVLMCGRLPTPAPVELRLRARDIGFEPVEVDRDGRRVELAHKHCNDSPAEPAPAIESRLP